MGKNWVKESIISLMEVDMKEIFIMIKCKGKVNLGLLKAMSYMMVNFLIIPIMVKGSMWMETAKFYKEKLIMENFQALAKFMTILPEI